MQVDASKLHTGLCHILSNVLDMLILMGKIQLAFQFGVFWIPAVFALPFMFFENTTLLLWPLRTDFGATILVLVPED